MTFRQRQPYIFWILVVMGVGAIAGEIWIYTTGALNLEGVEISTSPDFQGSSVNALRAFTYGVGLAIRCISIFMGVVVAGVFYKRWRKRRPRRNMDT